jgi:integrase
MAILHRLKQAALKTTQPGLYGDGGGLLLQITRSPRGHANRSWLFRFRLNGKRREMGIGPLHTIGLKDARERAAELRRTVYRGVDPIEQRRRDRAAKAIEIQKAMTFDQCAQTYARSHSAKWAPKHATQWTTSIARFVSPRLGKLPIGEIDTSLVIKTLESIWHEKPETASRVRQRIEAVLAWATVRGLRTGDNPARWTGHLDQLLPSKRELQPVEHFAALPHAQIPGFLAKLRQRSGATERLIEFIVLTAARKGEALGARWDEIDGTIWTIPPERMKSARQHRVPLSPRAMEILDEMRAIRQDDHVFPGARGSVIGETTVRLALARMGFAATVHGFRSSFRDWCGERTNFSREVAEMCLAHAVGNRVEQAYARADLLEQRRRVMNAWAEYCVYA